MYRSSFKAINFDSNVFRTSLLGAHLGHPSVILIGNIFVSIPAQI